MREILFRGKRLDNGEWVQGYLFIIWERAYILWGTTNGAPDMIDVDPSTVGQYTGLTDKNGKKIFEGDVLEIVGEAAECIFKSDLRFSVEYKTTGENACGYSLPDCIEYEVIGNIHDNPELLEEV